MARRIPLLALALASAFAAPAFAEQVTVSYQGVVTNSSGPQSVLFVAGQEVTVSYTVETTAADSDPNPDYGVYHGGLVALRVTIPAVGVDAEVGTGTVQTFDNIVDTNSDQAFFYGNALAGNVDGLAIPTDPLVTDDSFAIFRTAAGTTFVNFVVEPDEPTPAELVEDASDVVQDLVDDGRLRTGNGRALDSKLASVLAAIDAGDTATACGSLRAFQNQVNALERSRRIDAASAAELRAAADAIGDALGC